MHNTASLNIDAVSLTSSDILQELIFQSMERIIGGPHTIITRDLPVSGHHVLATDSVQQPVLVTFDPGDGGRAFLAAMSALEHIKNNRGWLFRLYPSLFNQANPQHHALRVEDMRVILVVPEPPPGSSLLCKLIPQLHIFTFQAISINGDIGLLLTDDDTQDRSDTDQADQQHAEGLAPFRRGHYQLNSREEAYFNALGL